MGTSKQANGIESAHDSEIEQVRKLLFGEAKLHLEQDINDSNHALYKELEEQRIQFNRRIDDLEQMMKMQAQSFARSLEELSQREDKKVRKIDERKLDRRQFVTLLQSWSEQLSSRTLGDTHAEH